MSETEHYFGKLIPVDKTAEQICKEELDYHELERYYDDWEEALNDIAYKDGWVVINGTVYKAELSRYGDWDDVFEGRVNPDGSISVQAKFYNGGCSLNEALEECLNRAK